MAADATEVVVVASTSEQSIGVWDVHTATLLTTFKGSTCGRNALTTVGRDHLGAAQSGKGQALCMWAWHKDQVHLRSYSPEAVASFASTKDGILCAAGGLKGTIYVWETASGRLLKTFAAHYKCVTALAFSDDSSILVSSGEDAIVAVWQLMSLLDGAGGPAPGPSSQLPLHSWSQHTLPISALYLGAGRTNPVVASASLDRTCRIWSLATGHLLRTIKLPTALLSITADAWENSLYLGANDGRIFEASLVSCEPALGENGAGMHTLVGHSKAVTSLGTTPIGYHLVSGSEDGSVRVWDLRTRQTLRVINAKSPVSCLLVLRRPPHMTAGSSASTSRRGPKRVQPVAVLRKYVDTGEAWQSGPVVIDGIQPYRGNALESKLLFKNQSGETTATDSAGAEISGVVSERMEAENAKLQAQVIAAAKTIADLKSVNAKMHAFVVESSLAGGVPGE